MSESQNYEEATVASNGVTVIKTFEEDAFPVPAIAFRIKSDRTETVTIRLVDEVPENVAVEDLGFHPEYGSEHWTIEDDEITFERELESEEQYTTVYGIRATGTDDVSQFLTEPTIADVDPPLEDEDGVVGGSGSDVVRDVISGNADSVPGLDDDEDEDIGTLDLTDPNADDEEEDEDDEAEAEEEDEEDDDEAEAEEEAADEEADESADEEESDVSTNGAMADVDSIASALATEIREGNVADDDLELIRDELDIQGGGGGAGGGAADARIERLQKEVSDLQAYTDALEEFLEEEGTGEDLIQDVQNQLESVEGQLDTVDDLENQVNTMESQLEGVDDVDDQLSSLESDVDQHSSQFDDLDGELDELENDLKSLKADIKDLDDDVEDLQDGMSTVESELDDIDDVDDQVEDIEDDIEELKEWREQLSNVLGAADGGD